VNYETDKVMRLVDEMGMHLMRRCGAEELDISVRKAGGGYRIRIESSLPDLSPGKLQDLREKLSSGRKPEFEDYYWQLSGDSLNRDALSLVAMMCDAVDVDYREGRLILEMTRGAAGKKTKP